MIKSFLNYPGGKYRLLSQILPLFPKDYDQFVDMFTGSAVVAVNSELSVPIFAYDLNSKLIELLRFVQSVSVDNFIGKVEELIAQYNLSNTGLNGYDYYGLNSSIGVSSYNKRGYMNLRQDYNNGNTGNVASEIYLYILIVYGFNNQIRFNKKGMFNNPTGKRDFNEKMQKKLIDFSRRVQNMDIDFIVSDYNDVSEKLMNAFYYVDPPYLITTAVYNENGGWSKKHEINLLNKLDAIDDAGNTFALSNVLTAKGKHNEILSEWSKKYIVHHLNMKYDNANYQASDSAVVDEVLITNY